MFQSDSAFLLSLAQMELDRSADPPPAIWVSTTKSSVNKWVSMCDTSEITEPLSVWSSIDGGLFTPNSVKFKSSFVIL